MTQDWMNIWLVSRVGRMYNLDGRTEEVLSAGFLKQYISYQQTQAANVQKKCEYVNIHILFFFGTAVSTHKLSIRRQTSYKIQIVGIIV